VPIIILLKSAKVNQFLRILRKAKGLSQEALAERADTHSTYIGVIERGEQSPTLQENLTPNNTEVH